MTTQDTQAPSTGTPEKRSIGKVVFASLIGTATEWYDFFLFGSAAALVFGEVFFGEIGGTTGTLYAFMTYALGFAARPLGGIVFGHFGDKVGRKKMLVASLLLMGVGTFAIGLLPTYATIGIAAPILLVFCRLLQGFAVGGEWGGAVLMAAEHGDDKNRGFWTSWPQAGVALGNLFATGVLFVLAAVQSEEAFLDWGWRIPFLLSAVLVVAGLVIRLRLDDAAEFTAVREAGEVERLPLATVLRHHRRAVLVTAGLRLAQPALFAVLTTYVLTYLADRRGDSGPALVAVLIVSALSLASTPFWGWVSDRVGRRPLTIASAVGIGVFVWPLFAFLDHGPLALLPLVMVLGMNLLHDAIYGPQAAWFAEQFPTQVRYTGVSLGYQLGSIVSVGLTPLLAVWLVSIADGSAWLLCGYLTLLAVLTVAAALAARPVEPAARGEATSEVQRADPALALVATPGVPGDPSR